MKNRQVISVISVCLIAVITAACSEKPVESNDPSVNPVEIDMTQPGIRHVEDLKHMEYFADDDAYALYSYVAPEKAKEMRIEFRQYIDGVESDNCFEIMTIEDLELKNKAGYIGILNNPDDNYSVKVTNYANTGSSYWTGDISIDSKHSEGDISTHLNNDYDCKVREDYVLFCYAVHNESEDFGGYTKTEEIIQNSKAANLIIVTFE